MKRGPTAKAGKVARQAVESETAAEYYPPDHPRVASLAAKIETLQLQKNRDEVETVAELGSLLEKARDLLGPAFTEWIEERGLSRRTAYNYMGVSALAAARPDLLRDWKEMGASKFYMLTRVAANRWDRILKPEHQEKILRMTDVEFFRLVDKQRGRRPEATPIQLANGYRSRFRTWREHLDGFEAWVKESDEVPAGLVEEYVALRARILELDALLA